MIPPLDGITAVALPVGINSVGTVNMYVLADGDNATVVDCGYGIPSFRTAGSKRSSPACVSPATTSATCPG